MRTCAGPGGLEKVRKGVLGLRNQAESESRWGQNFEEYMYYSWQLGIMRAFEKALDELPASHLETYRKNEKAITSALDRLIKAAW